MEEKTMRMHAWLGISVVVPLICASVAQGSLLEPVYIERYVEAFRWPDNPIQYGTGVAPFSAAVSTPGGLATATQNSTITADTVSITGSASAYGDSDLGSFAGLLFKEKFIITSRTPYRFSSEWNMGGYPGQGVHFYLSSTSDTIFEQYGDRTGNWTWATGGYLDPGQYTFSRTALLWLKIVGQSSRWVT